MRKRERERVAEVARRRLEHPGAELAGLRPEQPPVEEPPAEMPPVKPVPVGTVLDKDWQSSWEPTSFLDEPRPLLSGSPGSLPAGPREVAHPGRHARDRHRPGTGAVRGWVGDRMPDSVRGRVALSSQHTAVVVAVVGIALALAGWLALRSGAQDDVVPQARFVASATSPSADPASAGGASVGESPGTGAPSATGAPGVVVVDVAGKVRRPGIVTLPTGSRVHDALKKAGGARPGTGLVALNLARVLVDGEQILVGQPAPAGVAPSAVGSTPGPAGGLVNLNSAGLSELDTLPGVGPVTAQKILDWRSAHGAFSSVDELLEVDGIGDKTLADIAPHVTL
ncbi:MAG: helix-hairpin-helix domain-containing protein [Marmoricola sp.]